MVKWPHIGPAVCSSPPGMMSEIEKMALETNTASNT